MNDIHIKNLYKIYDQDKPNEFKALDNINLTIKESEIIILKGKSGSGKSTLLSVLSGISKPTSGDIIVNGENIVKLPDTFISEYRNKELGFVFQSFNLINGLSVYDNVLAPLTLSKLKTKELREKVNQALKIASIDHKVSQNVESLSGGEKQRCAIARAIVMDPNCILADEPTANLDKENSLKFIDILKKFKKMNKTVIVATHDNIFDNLDFVDTYINIENGKLI